MKTDSNGADLWQKAKSLIPGGSQLLSKRAEMFLPDGWPSYYEKARGVEIWDLQGRKLIDMSLMGVGSCVLGYAHDEVNAAVIRAVEKGNMSTLNCPEEVELAEALLQLHPGMGQARFAKTGGEACTIAVRIARAFTQRSKIAFCGYHGWHDWYLAANLGNSHNLDGQLLPGLLPSGVPRELKDTAFPFHYGNLEELRKVLARHPGEFAAIMMEVARHDEPDVPFLRAVQDLANQSGVVLIYDEITSGFRRRAGGMHTLHDLQPGLVVLGKGMGNGYPIAAILGRTEIMQAAQETFISSTYWTERIGYAAALAVLDQFRKHPVADHLQKLGRQLKAGWQRILQPLDLKIHVSGLPEAPYFEIKEEDPLLVKTLFTQEMLQRGYLASNLVYMTWAHSSRIIEDYLGACREVFELIAKAKAGGDLKEKLRYPVCHSGFRRLT